MSKHRLGIAKQRLRVVKRPLEVAKQYPVSPNNVSRSPNNISRSPNNISGWWNSTPVSQNNVSGSSDDICGFQNTIPASLEPHCDWDIALAMSPSPRAASGGSRGRSSTGFSRRPLDGRIETSKCSRRFSHSIRLSPFVCHLLTCRPVLCRARDFLLVQTGNLPIRREERNTRIK